MQTITQAKEHLTGMLHGGSLNKVRNIEAVFERAANTMLLKLDPVDTIRVQPLSNTIHDDVFNYSLPSDYKKIIDLIPQDNRNNSDNALRNTANYFDVQKLIKQKRVSIEGSEGSKIIRVNWRSRSGKVFHSMNSVTNNGNWVKASHASITITADTINKKSGSASLKFSLNGLNLIGQGIQNYTMNDVDLTDENGVGDFFVWVYFENVSEITSIETTWGSSVGSNYWTGIAQTTQADGSAFKIGWNQIKIPWSTATETGTVDPSVINYFKITFTITGEIDNIRVDNIICSIGRNFDFKYYTKYIFKNSSGTLLSRPTSDDDNVLLDNDGIQIWLLETLIACAQQVEGADSGFDINWAERELYGVGNKPSLYDKYKKEYPSESKKSIGYYGSRPARGRW